MKRRPLVILTIDAGDCDMLRTWSDEGHLPAVASILQRGCFGRTTGAELVNEHGIWLSMLSGVSRGRYGYYSYRQLRPGTYELHTVTPLQLDVQPFWHALRGSNLSVGLIDAPDAFPLPDLQGIQLANWATHHNWDPHHPDLQPSALPPELLDEARRIFGPPMHVVEKQDSTLAEDREIHRRLLERTRRKGRLCRELLGRGPFDLTVVGFSETHPASHQFWRKFRPEGGQKSNDLTHAIRDAYVAVDRELGELLRLLPQDADVFLVSSAGLDDYYPHGGLIEAFMRHFGYQTPPEASPQKADLSPMGLARRILPESVRVALSQLVLSREARERIVAGQFQTKADWSKTRAFAIPSAYTSFVRVNLRGREPMGCVEPGAEYDELLREMTQKLRELVDPETGQAAVRGIWRSDETFGGGELPDLFIEWKPGGFMERVVHGPTGAGLTQKRPAWFRNSDHLQHGFIAAAGPSIHARGDIGDVELLDLAPTFLQLLGQRPAAGMTGRALTRLFQA